MTPLRVAVATNCIPPYRFPIFRDLSKNPALSLRVFVSLPLDASCDLARSHLRLRRPLTFNFNLGTRHAEVGAKQRELVPLPIGLIWSLIWYRPDSIISGDFGPRSVLCWLVARLIRAKLLIWTEEIQSSARGRSAFQRAVRRLLLPRADGFFAWGEPARDYLASQGVKPDTVTVLPQAIDLQYWSRLRPKQSRDTLRRELGLSKLTFLLVGRLIERKGFDRFIKSWAALPPALASQASAVIVGSGELGAELCELSTRCGAKNIEFKGGLSADELAKFYAACDVLIFPSLEDVWGMVVNEALFFGMPVLGSIHAGAVQQLICAEGTGEAFDPNDSANFTRILQQWIEAAPVTSAERCRDLAESLNPVDGANAMAARLLQQSH